MQELKKVAYANAPDANTVAKTVWENAPFPYAHN